VQLQDVVDPVGELFHTMARMLREIELLSIDIVVILAVNVQ